MKPNHSFSDHIRLFFIALFALAFFAGVAAHAAQVTLTWTDNATNEDGTAIERAPGLNATTGFAVIANVASTAAEKTGTGSRSYVDAGLPNATAYTYRLRAYNVAGASGYSNTASGTTPPPTPAAPGAPSIDSGPAYTPPPVVVVSATLTMQGGVILAANVVASPESGPN